MESEQLKSKSLFLADSVRQSSDNLTTMARNYTVTGEPRYRKYFNQIIDIRNGSIHALIITTISIGISL